MAIEKILGTKTCDVPMQTIGEGIQTTSKEVVFTYTEGHINICCPHYEPERKFCSRFEVGSCKYTGYTIPLVTEEDARSLFSKAN